MGVLDYYVIAETDLDRFNSKLDKFLKSGFYPIANLEVKRHFFKTEYIQAVSKESFIKKSIALRHPTEHADQKELTKEENETIKDMLKSIQRDKGMPADAQNTLRSLNMFIEGIMSRIATDDTSYSQDGIQAIKNKVEQMLRHYEN